MAHGGGLLYRVDEPDASTPIGVAGHKARLAYRRYRKPASASAPSPRPDHTALDAGVKKPPVGGCPPVPVPERQSRVTVSPRRFRYSARRTPDCAAASRLNAKCPKTFARLRHPPACAGSFLRPNQYAGAKTPRAAVARCLQRCSHYASRFAQKRFCQGFQPFACEHACGHRCKLRGHSRGHWSAVCILCHRGCPRTIFQADSWAKNARLRARITKARGKDARHRSTAFRATVGIRVAEFIHAPPPVPPLRRLHAVLLRVARRSGFARLSHRPRCVCPRLPASYCFGLFRQLFRGPGSSHDRPLIVRSSAWWILPRAREAQAARCHCQPGC